MSEFKLTPEVAAEVCDVLLTRVPRRKLGNPGRSCLARVSRRKLGNPGDQDGERRTNELPLQGPPTLTGRKFQWNVPCTDEAVEDFVLRKFGGLPKGSWSSSFSVKEK